MFRIEITAEKRTIEVNTAKAAAGWIAYAKRAAGYKVGACAKSNWEKQLDRIYVGSMAGYAVPDDPWVDFCIVEKIA